MKFPVLALATSAALLLGACAIQPPVAPAEPQVVAPRPVLDVISDQLQSLTDSGVTIERLDGVLRLTMPGSLAFASNSRDVEPAGREVLDQIASALQAAPDTSARIVGHTDSTGSAGYNQTLSVERAEAVMMYLAEQGIDDARLEASGRGEEMPAADNSTAEGRAENRRVEIEIEG